MAVKIIGLIIGILMVRYNTRESSPAINPVLSRYCGGIDNKI